MTETSKKRNKSRDDKPNQTIISRTIINANWQKLLASNLISEKKTEKPPLSTANKEHFTGTFRRDRKKKIEKEKLLDVGKSFEVTPESNQSRDEEKKLTRFLAIDCEMVGIGLEGRDHMLARVSLVNKFGDCIYDKFVKPREEVVDYRTKISGIRKEDLLNGEEFDKVQKEVAELIRGKILVGHAINHDLSVLFLSHPKKNIRDTSKHKPFRVITKGSTPSLKRLTKEILGVDIQHGEHSSVEDARAVMQLYRTAWEKMEKKANEKKGRRGN